MRQRLLLTRLRVGVVALASVTRSDLIIDLAREVHANRAPIALTLVMGTATRLSLHRAAAHGLAGCIRIAAGLEPLLQLVIEVTLTLLHARLLRLIQHGRRGASKAWLTRR